MADENKSTTVSFDMEDQNIQSTPENKEEFELTGTPENIETNSKPEDINIESTGNNPPVLNNEPEYDVNAIYSFLRDNNIAPVLGNDDKIENIKDIANYITQHNNKFIQDTIQQELSQYPQQYQDLFNYVKNGGRVEDFVQSYSTTYTELNPDMLKGNLDLQKQIMEDYYRYTTQWDDKMIKITVGKYNDDEVKDISKNMLEQLKGFEYQQKQQLFEQQQQQQAAVKEYWDNLYADYDKQINELNKIGDMDFTERDKVEVRDLLFNNKTFNKLNTEFDKYRLPLAILDKYGLLDDINKLSQLLNKPGTTSYNFVKQNTQNNTKSEGFDFNIVNPKDNNNKGSKVDFIF